MSNLVLRIRRRTAVDATPTWSSFELTPHSTMTVADALDTIDADVRWSDACEWPSCGVCTMLVNRRARPACGTRLADVAIRSRVVLEPLLGFPVRRDLIVDRTRMTSDVARLKAWPRADASETTAQLNQRLPFTACTRCGACIDACPESDVFVGAAAVGAQHAARLRGADPAIVETLLDPGGITNCGQSQACVEACPENIPLDEAIAKAHGDASRLWLRQLLRR
jgi:succinate dehydrogenase / fumarate reductase iron-sulfur subunit